MTSQPSEQTIKIQYLLLEILGSLYIAIVCFGGCEIINSEINHIFLIKSLFHMTKKSRKKSEYFEKKKSS